MRGLPPTVKASYQASIPFISFRRIENVGQPLAVTLMAKLGIDISKNESTSANVLSKNNCDVVVTVYDNSVADCQVWFRGGKIVHISFLEPADAAGTDEEKMALFRSVREVVRGRPQCHSQFDLLLFLRGAVNPDGNLSTQTLATTPPNENSWPSPTSCPQP